MYKKRCKLIYLFLIVSFLINSFICVNADCTPCEEGPSGCDCTSINYGTGADAAEYCDINPCSSSQINSMTPYQLSEFYSNLGMVTKYSSNFKQYCKDHTCTSTQLSYVDSLSTTDQEDFWSDHTIKTKYPDEYKAYLIAHPDFAAEQIYAERLQGYTTTIRILETLPSPSIRTDPQVAAAMIDYYDNSLNSLYICANS